MQNPRLDERNYLQWFFVWLAGFVLFFFNLIFLSFCLFFMAVPTAYGSSQASGGIRASAQAYTTATATATATATLDPSLICDLPHSSRQRQILNPLSETMD